jgi:cytochrome P450
LQALGFLGNGSLGGTVEFVQRVSHEYGSFSSWRILHKRIYFVDDPDLIQEILVTRQHEFVRDSGATLLRELVGDGLLTREEPLHRERRRILQPAFHKEQIAAYASTMAAESAKIAGQWSEDKSIDVRREMRRLTLSIVAATLFGTEFHDEAARMATILDRVARRSTRIAPIFSLVEPAALLYRRVFPRGRSLLFERERTELEQLIAPILAKRRAGQGRDILALLMNSKDGVNSHLSDEDVKNEVITFVLAGHETTATALTWTWLLLSEHPESAERMHAELDQVLGTRLPTLADVPALDYTAKVFKESMRLYPPALLFARRPKERLDLGGYTIQAGESIFLSPFVTQRNPRYFPEPDAFRPERWSATEPKRFAYFPFGGGAKMCIGEPFARLEGVLALAILAQRWHLHRQGMPPLNIRGGALPRSNTSVFMQPVARTALREHLSEKAV